MKASTARLLCFVPGIIINAAAYTAVDKAETEPERCYAVNHAGARQLAEAASRRNVPLIHVSTDYVFDGKSPLHIAKMIRQHRSGFTVDRSWKANRPCWPRTRTR